MEGLIMAAQIILSLSILVGVHEMGHLLAAKWFGMRVEQFSIGFPPKIWGFKYGETEYNLSLIPLGGFVKISGMIDESMDKEQMAQPPKEYEFRSKPAWQRLIVMLGGIIVNVITGILIFVCLTYFYGDLVISKDQVNANGGIIAMDLGQELGLQTGDQIIKINGKDYEDFADVMDNEFFFGDGAYYTVLRDGEQVNISIPPDFIEKLNDKEAAGNFILPKIPVTVSEMNENTLAERLGLQEDDIFISLGGQEVVKHEDVRNIISSYKEDTIATEVRRNGEVLNLQAAVQQDTLLGIMVGYPEGFFKSVDYSFGESIGMGTEQAFSVVFLQIKAFGKMFSGELNPMKSLSGPIGIAKAYGGEWQWQRFWNLTGLLSMVLAFMNLLPIPALDGGHVMFLSYEIISGRKPSDKFLENAQKVGMVFLLALMVFIIGNDILKIFI
ncbi:RIP metalloprotease RseP [Fulvivirga sp. RKSG066]|uniref:RIP metalloprotease RseP n=1 Tax=Fulvivirga aurantia TaxID=2529383 RepID=UPI0012BD4E4F|nr:RIP metalloprotease RseP [Fulvivirga aurantia]MTI20674.1 RIP metalloprotease RseP [Fulvivirga aurantia]